MRLTTRFCPALPPFREQGAALPIDRGASLAPSQRPAVSDPLPSPSPEHPVPAPDGAHEAEARAFRQLMGQFATGVAVVALRGEGGRISAMTINSLVSLSLSPMLVSWSLQNSASQYAAYAGASRFAISILAEDQAVLARRYAARGDSALLPGDFEEGAGGLPAIRGALGQIACRRFAAHPAGDHTLIIGEVIAMARGLRGARPLVFFGGRFGGLEQDH